MIDQFPDKFNVVGLSANDNIDLLEQQVRKFKPAVVAVKKREKAREIKRRLRDLDIKVLTGEDGLNEISVWPGAELVVVAVVGFSGLQPTISALEEGKTIALANKETLVAGGELVMKKAREKGLLFYRLTANILLFQCLHAGSVRS